MLTIELEPELENNLIKLAEQQHISVNDLFKQLAITFIQNQLTNKPTQLNDVAGCLAYQGKTKTLDEMNQAIEQGIITEQNQGYGNYVEDRKQWQKDYSVTDILAEMGYSD
jgi:hypothetical protein